MNKKVFIVLLLCFSLFMCGCEDKLSSAKKMDDVVLTLFKSKSYDKKTLSSEQIKLIDNLIKDEKYQNKVINLSEFTSYNDITTTNLENSNGVYEKDGIYYIKYSDISFEKNLDTEQTLTNDNKSYYLASINFDGKTMEISKEVVPVLYDDTANNSKYVYVYRGTATYQNKIVSYYNSAYDNTGMEIIFNTSKNKITSININYDNSTEMYVVDETSASSKRSNAIILGISATILFVFAIIFIVKKVKIARKF